jgi:hypothetical protein
MIRALNVDNDGSGVIAEAVAKGGLQAMTKFSE